MEHSFDGIINKVITSSSIGSLIIALKECYDFLNSRTDEKRLFIKRFTNEMEQLYLRKMNRASYSFKEGLDLFPSIFIYESSDSLHIYVAKWLKNIYKINVFKIRLSYLISTFENEFTDAKSDIFTRDVVIDILSLLQNKYKLLDILTAKSPFELFIFNNSHIKYNSMCEAYINQNDNVVDSSIIMLFALRRVTEDKYQVLFHEIGHALQLVLTHKLLEVPDSFIKMNEPLKVYLKNGVYETTDVFADTFSAAAMYNTNYANNNVFVEKFPKKLTDKFDEYFKKLISYAYDNLDILKTQTLDITVNI